MIIGISGKMQSGKNTVATIINQLTNNIFEEKAFAGKLKECVSLITGISLVDLEKEEVKSKVIWERWYNYHYKLQQDINPSGRIDIYCATQKDVEKQHDAISNTINGHSFTKENVTIRKMLQELGTNVCREIHPNFWINALFADYKQSTPEETVISRLSDGNNDDFRIGKFPSYPKWIITDVRFPNEAQAIKDRGGFIIRVQRDIILSDKVKFDDFSSAQFVEINHNDEHPSEIALDDYNFDYTIDNNGTIEELIEKVKIILIKEKII